MAGSPLDDDMEAGRARLAELRREVWPDHGGEWPEDPPTDDDLNRYIEVLESAVVGQRAAMRLIARTTSPRL